MLVSEELAGSAVAALNLIEDEHRAVLVALLAQAVQKLVGGNLHTAHALNAFNNHSANVVGSQLAAHCLEVVERQEGDVTVIVHRSHNLGVVGSLNCQRGAAVERLVEGNNAATSVIERRQLQRILVGFSARIDEEQLIIVVAARFAKFVSQALLQAINHRVAVEHQVLGLVLECLYVMRM